MNNIKAAGYIVWAIMMACIVAVTYVYEKAIYVKTKQAMNDLLKANKGLTR